MGVIKFRDEDFGSGATTINAELHRHSGMTSGECAFCPGSLTWVDIEYYSKSTIRPGDGR